MEVTKLRLQPLVLLAAISFSSYTTSQTKDDFAQNTKSAPPGGQTPSAGPGQSTISGCLRGRLGGYRLTEKDGTPYLLMEQGDLSAHVLHTVQFIDYADDDRDANASSDEVTPTPARFFQVEQVASDSGSCIG